MNDATVIDCAEAPPQEPTQALAVRPKHAVEAVAPQPERPPVTAAQAKVEAVANLTFKAYERASTLSLTPDEIKKLQADFPDEAFKTGAAGKESLIYIEHAFLRDRLNDVIGVGQWALIPRSRWAEDFVTRDGKPAARVYVEAMLVVRGAFVAEAVGEMEYYSKNAAQNYGDAVEGAKTAAFRRCCKEFGIGLQAWKKDWCAGWWSRRNGTRQAAPAADMLQSQAPERPRTSAPAPAPEPAPAPVSELIHLIASVDMVSERQGTAKNGKPWKAWFVVLNDGTTTMDAGTFSETLGKAAHAAYEASAKVDVVVKPGRKAGSYELVSLVPVTDVQEVTP